MESMGSAGSTAHALIHAGTRAHGHADAVSRHCSSVGATEARCAAAASPAISARGSEAERHIRSQPRRVAVVWRGGCCLDSGGGRLVVDLEGLLADEAEDELRRPPLDHGEDAQHGGVRHDRIPVVAREAVPLVHVLGAPKLVEHAARDLEHVLHLPPAPRAGPGPTEDMSDRLRPLHPFHSESAYSYSR